MLDEFGKHFGGQCNWVTASWEEMVKQVGEWQRDSTSSETFKGKKRYLAFTLRENTSPWKVLNNRVFKYTIKHTFKSEIKFYFHTLLHGHRILKK